MPATPLPSFTPGDASPGPWYVTLTPYTVASRGPMGVFHFVATTAPETGLGTPAEASANARLISAAPEMYEALRVIIREHDLGRTPLASDMAQARSAMAKADGESQA